jgi:subtilisin family serine protease
MDFATATRRALAGALLLALFAPLAHAQTTTEGLRKLDDTARLLVEARTDARLAQEVRRLEGRADVAVAPDGSARAGVLIRLSDPAALPAIEAAGFRLETLAGPIAVGTADVSRLADIAGVESVESVSVAEMLHLMNDFGGEAIGLPFLHAGTGLPHQFRGDGVVVGVLDTGIDFTHPDFSDQNGTRIEYLLDYLPDGNNPPTAHAVYTKADIDNNPAGVLQRDVHGHGTHVAGTAAGGGNGIPDFIGAAPQSRLVVVKGTRTGDNPQASHTFSERDMINGTAWIFDRADDLGMPAVVNLSVGSLRGPLDGSDNGSLAMSALAGPGRIIVFAGGNDGARYMHWGSDLSTGASATMAFEYSTANNAYQTTSLGQAISVTGWYDTGSISSITLTARDPGTHQELASITLPVGQNHPDYQPLMSGNTLLGYGRITAVTTEHPDNGDGTFSVTVASMHQAQLSDRLWSVTLEAAQDGRADVWIGAWNMGAFVTDATAIPGFVPGDQWMTINRWAAAERVISAGSFTTRNQWVNENGQTVGFPSTRPLGRRTPFSGQGPTRDGRLRPDVLAPGSHIASALTSSNTFGLPMYAISDYTLAAGTSMAAPFLAGTVALMLQANATLDPEMVRQILHDTAIVEAEMGGMPNPSYGHGKLDAVLAVQAALQTVSTEDGGAPLAGLTLDAPYPNPTRGAAHLAFSLPTASRAEVAVFDLLGRRVRTLIDDELAAGPHRVTLERQGLAAGVYFVTVASGAERRTQRVVMID